ncbi:TraX family protein [Escherichia marmotae]|nr:TraX family protein [Escherichia marmotae]
MAGFPWYEGNILFAFAVAAQVLTWCETRTWWRSAGTMLLLAVWLPLSGTSYGIAGLLMLAVGHWLLSSVIWLCWAFWRCDGCGIFDRNRMIRQRKNTA